jgi:3'-phosphoadenosine 5'-phosphosulfate (PAPS) 3'-phosphatase
MTEEPLSPETRRYLTAALAACRCAGAIHRRHFRSSTLAVDLKADASPVTAADRGSEEAIREILHLKCPELGLLGEEFGQEGSERDRWVIDPLDATKNFVAGLPFFATLIALELDGEFVLGVVHAPALGPGAGLSASAIAGKNGGDDESLSETWWGARGEGAWGGTGTTLATCRQRRLRVSETAEVERAFVVHGGLNLFQKNASGPPSPTSWHAPPAPAASATGGGTSWWPRGAATPCSKGRPPCTTWRP